jgi:hypothetical protein
MYLYVSKVIHFLQGFQVVLIYKFLISCRYVFYHYILSLQKKLLYFWSCKQTVCSVDVKLVFCDMSRCCICDGILFYTEVDMA